MLNRIDVQNNPVNWIDPWGLIYLDDYMDTTRGTPGHRISEGEKEMLRGVGDYFKGIYYNIDMLLRLSGAKGECEKVLAQTELWLLEQYANGLVRSEKLRNYTWNKFKDYVNNNPDRIGGQAIGGVITAGIGASVGKVWLSPTAFSLSKLGAILGIPASKLEEIENIIRCVCGELQ